MTLRIFRSTVAVLLFCIALCTAMLLGVLYSRFEDQVYDELASEAALAAQGVELGGTDYLDHLDQALENRLTLVDTDGTVLYDSAADAAALENHADREEIREAMQTGIGQSAHQSQVFSEKTLYYALRLSDGRVIRISCEQDTVAGLLLSTAAPLAGVLAAALALSALLASRLAHRITQPINDIDLDRPMLSPLYKELAPLLRRIRQQNQTIHQQMAELSSRQQEFTAITENMSEGFLLIDNRACILSYNTSALRILNAVPSAAGGSVLQFNRSREFREAVDAALAGEHTETMLNLAERNYQLIGNPVTANGQVTGAVLLILDVTEREQREELRREFTANVSHELKTPLTSISGFAELMKDGLVSEAQCREFAGDIYQESRRLIALVEDIIRLSRLDEERFLPEREDIDLYDLAADAVSRLSAAADRQHVSVTLTGEHAVVSGPPPIVDEMVCNLLDNAIKYNKEGGSVTVSVTREDDAVRLSVADTGIGIPAADQSRVFERFYRVDKSHSKQIGGTGLGLSIVKHGAQHLGAQIELTSEVGRGTTITIYFPLPAQAEHN